MISAQSPVPIASPFFGPAYTSRAGNLADQRCINLYPEIVETKTGKEVGALYGCPGLVLAATLGSGPIRNMQVMGNLLYVVSGIDLYSLDASFNSTKLTTSTHYIGGSGGYMYSTGTKVPGFSAINLPFATGSASNLTMANNGTDLAIFVGMSVVQQDSYGLVNAPGTYRLYQSNEDDMSTWGATNFASASGDPDAIVALIQIRREVFVIKQMNTEVWNNQGTSPYVFGREQGPYMEAGCVAPASVAQVGETFFMLAQNRQGRGIVVKLEGYNLKRISTFAIEREIQSWPDITDAIGFAYQQEGHTFYILTSNSGDQTWCYDDTISALAGVPMWHQRERYSDNPGQPTRATISCATNYIGAAPVLVGDALNGNLYTYDLNTFTDNGAQRFWLRSFRALPRQTGKLNRFNSLILDMETGIGVPPGTSPDVSLRWSDDGGHTWVPPVIRSAGTTGETSQRVKFNRLGALRKDKGYDRIFEVSSADQFAPALIGARIDA